MRKVLGVLWGGQKKKGTTDIAGSYLLKIYDDSAYTSLTMIYSPFLNPNQSPMETTRTSFLESLPFWSK